MLNYFTNKLKEIHQSLKYKTENVIKSANEGIISNIQNSSRELTFCKMRLEEFSRDAVKELTVNEVIELLNNQLISHRDASYIYQYTKAISTNERDILVRLSYEYKNAKIK